MKPAAVSLFLLLLQSPPTTTPQQEAPKAALEGSVLNAITGIVVQNESGAPVSGAVMTLVPLRSQAEHLTSAFESFFSGQINVGQRAVPVTSDTTGRFLFPDVSPGRYEIHAAHPGFVQQEYSNIIDIAAGRLSGDVRVQLWREAVVTGSVISNTGAPLAGMEVVLLRFSYDADGQRNYRVRSSGKTDDRGVYRLFGIPPGQYTLGVRTPVGPSLENTKLAQENPNQRESYLAVPDRYVTTYFPNSRDVEDSTPLRLTSGMELKSMDFVLQKERLFSIRGSVVDSLTGLPFVDDMLISLVGRHDIGVTSFQLWPLARKPDESGKLVRDGTFEIENVIADDYWLVAKTTVPRTAGGSTAGLQRVSRIPLKVSNSDVNGIAVSLGSNVQISGTMRLENDSSLSAAIPNRTDIRIILIPPAVDAVPLGGIPRLNTPIESSGGFRFEDIVPDSYRLKVVGLSGVYVKDAFYDGIDVSGKPLTVSGGDMKGSLTIVLGSDGGRVTGTLRDSLGNPVINTEVVLVPQNLRSRVDLFRGSFTDAQSRFTFFDVPPGEYRLFSWIMKEPYFYFDPAALLRFEDQGVPVMVGSSAAVDVTLKAIASGLETKEP